MQPRTQSVPLKNRTASRSMSKLKIMIVQRQSNVSGTLFSRSVSARISQPLQYLSEQDKVAWQEIDENRVAKSDIDALGCVIFQKHRSSRAVEIAEIAKKMNVPIIYDLDDWILRYPSYSGGKNSDASREAFLKLLDLADIVTVSNERLLYEMRPFRSELELLPNGFHAEKYHPVNEESRAPYKVVFSNADYLKLQNFKKGFVSVLREFFKGRPEFELHFYGDPFPEIAELPFLRNFGSLSYEEHKRKLAAGGYAFAIAPLGGIEDHESFFFNCCKNPFKYLEYGGLLIPGIYSRSPIYENCVRPEETGLLVENRYEDWVMAMERLAGDEGLRADLRKASYEDVVQGRHIRFSAEKLWSLIERSLTAKSR
jgi:processive 1,2-diacylglycerol beta-glucosyltransferase